MDGNQDNKKILDNEALENTNEEISGDNAPVDELLNDIEHHPEEDSKVDVDDLLIDDDLLIGGESLDDFLSDDEEESTQSEENASEQTEEVESLADEILDEEEIHEEESDDEYVDEEEFESSSDSLLDKIKENKREILIVGGALAFVIPIMFFIFSNVYKVIAGPQKSAPVQQAAYLQDLNNPVQNQPAQQASPAQVQQKPVAEQNKAPTQQQTTDVVPIENTPTPQVKGISEEELQRILASTEQRYQEKIDAMERSLRKSEVNSNQANASISDTDMIDKNTNAILKIAERSQKFENMIMATLDEVKATQAQLREMATRNSENIEAQRDSISSIAKGVLQLKQSANNNRGVLTYSAPKKKSTPKPTYRLITASNGVAWVESIKKKGQLVNLEVGDNLIGYGRITAIDPYGQIMTTTGRVKIK